jgi:broad-specificity NMP kinase
MTDGEAKMLCGSGAVERLFEQLAAQSVDYVLLTAFEEAQQNGDIDLWVSHHHKDRFTNILQTGGWRRRGEPSRLSNRTFYRHFGAYDGPVLDVKFEGSFCRGVLHYLYRRGEAVFRDAMTNPFGIRRPAGADAIFLYAAHLAFAERGELEERHLETLRDSLDRYSAEHPLIAPSTALRELVYRSNRLDVAMVGALRAAIAPFFERGVNATAFLRPFQRIGIGEGCVVMVIGTDGTGKSTLVKQLARTLPSKTTRAYFGEKEFRFAFVERVLRAREDHMASPTKLMILTATYNWLLFPLELLRRRMAIVRGSRFRAVLIDRVPGFPFTSGSRLMRFVYRALLPRPDVLVLLHGDPDRLAARKPDATAVPIAKDAEKFRTVAQAIDAGVKVEIDTTDLSEAETAARVHHIVVGTRAFRDRIYCDAAGV